MSKEKSKADILAEKLDKVLVEAGVEPTKMEEGQGSFVMFLPKRRTEPKPEPIPKADNVIVDVKEENREAFVRKYELKGFKIEKIFSREDIVKSSLPITLDFEKKEIGRVGNVTCAAAAASQGAIIKEEDFLVG